MIANIEYLLSCEYILHQEVILIRFCEGEEMNIEYIVLNIHC